MNIITSLKNFISNHKRKIALFTAGVAFSGCVVGYVWASNKEAEARRGMATTSVSTPDETLDYESKFIIVGDTTYAKPAGYEDFPISGMNVKAYKFDEDGNLVEDNQPLSEVVPLTSEEQEVNYYPGYTYNSVTQKYEKPVSIIVNGKIVTTVDRKSPIKPQETPYVKQK